MSNLLKEAIADAKAVKATALANAKIALEESFQPTLQRMVSSKLAEEEDEEGELDFNIDFGDEEEAPVDDVSVGMDSFEDEPAPEAPVEPAPEEESDPELESILRELDFEGEEEPVEEEDEMDLEMEGEDCETEETWESILRELEEADCEDDEPVMERRNRSVGNSSALVRENKQLKAKLNEAYSVVTKLKKVVNEVNLLNSKLMYNTKAMKLEGLSQNQKIKIVEAFDRANTVREVKLVYATLMEQVKKAPVRKTAIASKTIPTAKGNKTPMVESNGILRLQQLAGIKKFED